jgi:hypothetical protein
MFLPPTYANMSSTPTPPKVYDNPSHVVRTSRANTLAKLLRPTFWLS